MHANMHARQRAYTHPLAGAPNVAPRARACPTQSRLRRLLTLVPIGTSTYLTATLLGRVSKPSH